MAFFPKLIILIGWMLIFRVWIVESTSTSNETTGTFFDLFDTDKSFRSKPNESSTFRALFRPDHFAANFSSRYTAHLYLYKLSNNGDASAKEYFCGDFPYSFGESDNTEVSIFPPTFSFNDTESDTDTTLNFMVAVIVGNNHTNKSTTALDKVQQGIFHSKTTLDGFFDRTVNHSQQPSSTKYINAHVFASYIFLQKTLTDWDRHKSFYTASKNSWVTLSPPKLSIPKQELDEGQEFIVAVIGKSKTLKHLDDGTSGGAAEANAPNGLFGIIGIIGAVALGLLRVQFSVHE